MILHDWRAIITFQLHVENIRYFLERIDCRCSVLICIIIFIKITMSTVLRILIATVKI